MEKSKIYCLLIIVISTLFGCNTSNSDMIWDIAPVNISFYVQDDDGNDLLNPKTEGNITEYKIKVIYDKKEYLRDEDMSETRAYMATLSGLMTEKDDKGYKLTFGEFDGAENHDKSFRIDMGDGAGGYDKISFTHRIEWKKNTPKTYTEASLNGEKLEHNAIIIMNGHRGMEWDFTPLKISFQVKDEDGKDLLNPETEGNITKHKIKVIYNDKEYLRDVDVSETRALPITFRGLMTEKNDNGYFLTFGEFERGTDHNKSFIIDWGDGTKDKVSFVHDFKWLHSDPITSTEVFLNGKKVEKGGEAYNSLTIIK